MGLIIPERLATACRDNPERTAWLREIPNTVINLAERWTLTLDDPFESDVSCAWVAPTRLSNGEPAILKLGMPHMEGEHEIAGLRFWNGDPTVRVLEADDRLGAMLLEGCRPGTSLRRLPESDQDVVVARLLQQLWRVPPAGHPFRPLSVLVDYWVGETLSSANQWSNAQLVLEGLATFRELLRTSPNEVLLATDLHAGNILEATRKPWMVIDPKPFIGDPAYDVTQHLFNCRERLRSDPHGLIRRVAELAALDYHRVRLWVFARAAADPRKDWNDSLMQIARALVD